MPKIDLAVKHYRSGAEKMKELDNKKGGETKKPKNMEKIIEQAFHHFSDACVELAEFAQAYFMRGRCYMHMTDYKRALYDFSAAILNQTRHEGKQPTQIKSEGGLASYYMYGGMCNYHLGQYEEAIAHYDIAKAKHEQPPAGDGPLLGQILYNRGLAYSSLMRFD